MSIFDYGKTLRFGCLRLPQELTHQTMIWGLTSSLQFGTGGSTQNAEGKLSRYRLNISCQDVNFQKSSDMICVW